MAWVGDRGLLHEMRREGSCRARACCRATNSGCREMARGQPEREREFEGLTLRFLPPSSGNPKANHT